MSTRRRQAGRRAPDPASLLAAPTDAPAAPLPSAADIHPALSSPLAAPTDAPSAPLPSAPDIPPAPYSPPPFERPNNVVGLVSDMIRDQKQGYMFLIITGGLLIILAACYGVVIWVMGASKGPNGIPIPAVIAGLPGAPLLAFLTSRVVRWIKRRLRTPTNDGRSDSSGG
jgi:hypothetical protein